MAHSKSYIQRSEFIVNTHNTGGKRIAPSYWFMGHQIIAHGLVYPSLSIMQWRWSSDGINSKIFTATLQLPEEKA